MIAYIKFAPWDKVYKFKEWAGGRPLVANDLKTGDFVIVKTDFGIDLGQVMKTETKEAELGQTETGGLRIILRKVTAEDLEKFKKREAEKGRAIEESNKLIKKYNLPIKLVDVLFHFDGGRITFAFVAPERIDFRELVKELSRKFHKSIRMYQITARQEAAVAGGDIGSCGQVICCRCFLKEIRPVGTDLINNQELTHRGIDRLLGVCGRLKCCLLYEEELYKELAAVFPAIGATVKTGQGKGEVIDRHFLKETLTIKTQDGVLIEVPLKDIK